MARMRSHLLALALLSLWAVASVAAVNFEDFADLAEPCRPFSCHGSGKKPVPKKSFVFTANGCGTASLPISAGPEFADCCNWHDACYSTCGMKKAKCESRLDKCMREKCATIQGEDERENCESTAKLFGFGAQTMGCAAYQQAQKEACRCVPAAKAASAMRDRLVHFLTVNGASEDELTDSAVDALLDKYKGREPLMFFRLLMKHPAALKIDASKKNFMDDILKGEPGENDLDKASIGKRARRASSAEPADDYVDEHIEL